MGQWCQLDKMIVKKASSMLGTMKMGTENQLDNIIMSLPKSMLKPHLDQFPLTSDKSM